MSSPASHSHYVSEGYLSAVEAGKQFGYTNDYVARLAREKKVIGVQEGRQWFVDVRSLEGFIRKSEEARKEQVKRMRKERRKERASYKKIALQPIVSGALVNAAHPSIRIPPRAGALAKAGLVLSTGVLMGSLFFNVALGGQIRTMSSATVMGAIQAFASRLYAIPAKPEIQPQKLELVGSVSTNLQAAPYSEEEGIVVLPPGDTTSESEVRASFSDETEVVFDEDGGSGLIKPIFKSGAESAYRFLLVPLKGDE